VNKFFHNRFFGDIPDVAHGLGATRLNRLNGLAGRRKSLTASERFLPMA